MWAGTVKRRPRPPPPSWGLLLPLQPPRPLASILSSYAPQPPHRTPSSTTEAADCQADVCWRGQEEAPKNPAQTVTSGLSSPPTHRRNPRTLGELWWGGYRRRGVGAQTLVVGVV